VNSAAAAAFYKGTWAVEMMIEALHARIARSREQSGRRKQELSKQRSGQGLTFSPNSLP